MQAQIGHCAAFMEDNRAAHDAAPSTTTTVATTTTTAPIEWWKFWEKASLGKAIGRILVPASVVTAAITAFGGGASRRSPGSVLLTSGCVFAIGIWLMRRKYLRDPAALLEYRAQISKSSLKQSRRDFGSLETLISGSSSLLLSLLPQTRDTYPHTESARIRLPHPPFCFHLSIAVVGLDTLQEKVLLETSHIENGLDHMWVEYEGGKNLTEMLRLGIVSRQYLLDKLKTDLGTSTNSNATVSHRRRPLLAMMVDYAEWLVHNLFLERTYLSSCLVHDPQTSLLNFEQAIELGAWKLHHEQQLLPLEWLHERAMQAITLERLSWSQIATKYAPWFLDENVCFPEHVQHLFRREEVQQRSFVELVTKWWSWPISRYQTRIGLTEPEYAKLRSLYDEFKLYSEAHDARVTSADALVQKQIENAASASATHVLAVQLNYSTLINLATNDDGGVGDSKFNKSNDNKNKKDKKEKKKSKVVRDLEAQQALELSRAQTDLDTVIARLESNKEKSVAEAAAVFNEQKIRLNREWSNFLSGITTSPPTSHQQSLLQNNSNSNNNNTATNVTVVFNM
jgi:hypothetical protein